MKLFAATVGVNQLNAELCGRGFGLVPANGCVVCSAILKQLQNVFRRDCIEDRFDVIFCSLLL